jgi:hypothetical protein
VADRPILFNDAMVRAILSGAKTQTRRPVKPQPGVGARLVGACVDPAQFFVDEDCEFYRCPFGVPGDRLWVREAHAVTSHHPPDDYPHIFYRADGAAHQHDGRSVCDTPDSSAYQHTGKWTPSIHMPRWASRLTLRVTDVRVERVQDITETEASLEGFREGAGPFNGSAKHTFAEAWPYKGAESWTANPWVWVVSFEREVKP